MKLNDKNLLKTKAYIDGEWVEGHKQFLVTNPVDGTKIAQVSDLGAKETVKAVEAAKKAQAAWANESAKNRGAILRKWADLMMEAQDDLALIMTLEQGKPLAESKGEIGYAASFLYFFAEEAIRVYGDVIPSPQSDRRILTLRQPIGVGAGITPWNFPSAMITRKAAPALALGCSMVMKPAEATPLSALALAELAGRAGLPAGVLNMVTGLDSQAIGEVLCTHPYIGALSFTGSTQTGKKLLAQLADGVKKPSMELGGNAPFIVFDDANLDSAIEGAMVSKFRNAGQTCVCANRIFVQDGIYDAFMDKFAARINALKTGNGLEAGVEIGPLINQQGFDKVDGLVNSALSQKAKAVIGGAPHGLGGNFYQPSLLEHIDQDMDIAQQEIFGPVASIIRFKQESDAIKMANDTPFGLAAYFYTQDLARSWRVSEKLEYGIIGLNCGIISTEIAPFGGVKQSGLGREGSKYGMDEWLEIKYIAMAGLS